MKRMTKAAAKTALRKAFPWANDIFVSFDGADYWCSVHSKADVDDNRTVVFVGGYGTSYNEAVRRAIDEFNEVLYAMNVTLPKTRSNKRKR